jgi:hypothetical protein
VLFGLPSAFGFTPDEDDDQQSAVVSHRAPLPPRLLHREDVSPFSNPIEEPSRPVMQEPRAPLVLPVDAPLLADVSPESGFFLMLSGALRERGFSLPELPDELRRRTNMTWSVKASVLVSPAGSVDYVLVQAGVDGEATARRVEAHLGRGRAREASAESLGEVRIGYMKPYAPPQAAP